MSLPLTQTYQKIPVLKPPPGVTSNFINPSSSKNAIIIVNVILVTLMLGFVALRIYTKGFLTRSVAWDDCEHFVKLCYLSANHQ